MKIRFVWIGATRRREYQTLENEYLKRIGRLIACERCSVAEARKTDRRQAQAGLKKEAGRVLAKLDSQSHLICLDQKGKMMGSRQWADQFRDFEEKATRELAFVVGGFMGIPADVQAEAQAEWSLGPMTLPHELARLVFLEQTYRALTLIRGLPYHR